MTKSKQSETRNPSCGVEEILSDPAASYWLKAALRSSLSLDPVDAANDAEVLSDVLRKRCEQIFRLRQQTE